jgi:hypothetical protein
MPTILEVQNLDGLPPDVLLEVAQEEEKRRCETPVMSIEDEQASVLIELYARTKFAAMKFRANGRIVVAAGLESCCELIYFRLPPPLRW